MRLDNSELVFARFTEKFSGIGKPERSELAGHALASAARPLPT